MPTPTRYASVTPGISNNGRVCIPFSTHLPSPLSLVVPWLTFPWRACNQIIPLVYIYSMLSYRPFSLYWLNSRVVKTTFFPYSRKEFFFTYFQFYIVFKRLFIFFVFTQFIYFASNESCGWHNHSKNMQGENIFFLNL